MRVEGEWVRPLSTTDRGRLRHLTASSGNVATICDDLFYSLDAYEKKMIEKIK